MSGEIDLSAGPGDDPGSLLDRPSPGRVALSWAYGAGRRVHHAMYERGWLNRGRLRAPVICVGNLTVGGTGKTPFLIELVHQLRERGRRPVVLSRGYGSRPPAREPRIISDGRGFFAEVERSGDEPMLLARRCPETPVVIGSRRFDAGRFAMREFAPDLFVLDDGFQHEALARDVDLVLWDVRDDPAGLRLLPAGRLREPIEGLRRATAIILTHEEYLGTEGPARRERIEGALRDCSGEKPYFRMESRLEGYRILGVDGSETAPRPLESPAVGPAFLVSGLARPGGFESMVRAAGIKVAGHLRLADHATYDARLVEDIRSRAKQTGAQMVLTTEKDAVKLEPLVSDGSIAAVALKIQIREEPAWETFLDVIAPRQTPKETDRRHD